MAPVAVRTERAAYTTARRSRSASGSPCRSPQTYAATSRSPAPVVSRASTCGAGAWNELAARRRDGAVRAAGDDGRLDVLRERERGRLGIALARQRCASARFGEHRAGAAELRRQRPCVSLGLAVADGA